MQFANGCGQQSTATEFPFFSVGRVDRRTLDLLSSVHRRFLWFPMARTDQVGDCFHLSPCLHRIWTRSLQTRFVTVSRVNRKRTSHWNRSCHAHRCVLLRSSRIRALGHVEHNLLDEQQALRHQVAQASNASSLFFLTGWKPMPMESMLKCGSPKKFWRMAAA